MDVPGKCFETNVWRSLPRLLPVALAELSVPPSNPCWLRWNCCSRLLGLFVSPDEAQHTSQIVTADMLITSAQLISRMKTSLVCSPTRSTPNSRSPSGLSAWLEELRHYSGVFFSNPGNVWLGSVYCRIS